MDHAMTPSWRKPAGVLAILALITIWAALIASASALINSWHWAFQALFYLVSGMIWIAPLKPLLLWMETGRWR